MDTKNIEQFKLLDLFKVTEHILEKNYKLYFSIIGISSLIGFLLVFLPMEDDIVYNVAQIILGLFSFCLTIILLRKVKTEIDVIETKRQKGNIIKQFLFMMALMVLFIIIIISIAVVAYLIASINSILETLVIAGLAIVAMPLIVGILYLSIISDAITFEVFTKNNVGISAIKEAFYNLHKSKNNTFTKIILSSLISLVMFTFLVIIAYYTKDSYLMVVVLNLLQSTLSLFFLTFNFVVYMSGVTEKSIIKAIAKDVVL